MSDNDSNLHDMGGNIGAASVRASSARDGGGLSDDAAPKSGYAESVTAAVGTDEQDPSIAGSDESGSANVPPTPGARSNYLEIDDVDNLGRGADGETADRLQQQDEGGPGA